jgi:2-polyprenyl-3-methyl-5-hydroxy-6-metoxy-1,4-benzoquinol methylase
MTDPIYSETADIESSTDAYADRFRGATGEWMLATQERITLEYIASSDGSTVLDVGGGHGQLARPLCKKGHHVTVLGSDASCRKRIADLADNGRCTFVVGDVINLPFEDRSFDTDISFRMLTHCGAWPQLVAELCRVARQAVVVDYPTKQSLNAIAPMLFAAKKNLEGNTRHWRLFRHAEVLSAFEANGFPGMARRGQFFLPMVMHRALRCRGLSNGMERICAALGLTPAWGSPVILKATRREGDS